MNSHADVVPTKRTEIPGWFYWEDRLLFDFFLSRQSGQEPGTLVEMGVYLGKSAVAIGDHIREGEEFVACDLFGATPEEADNARENTRSYSTLTRDAFERNYLTFHKELPTVAHCASARITEYVAEKSARFVHVDASHLFEHVHLDLRNTRALLRDGGIAVLDDYRSEHTPGVAAAVWQAVAVDGLVPICVTPTKFYGCFEDAGPHLDALRTWLPDAEGLWWEEQRIHDRPVLRVTKAKKKPAAPKPAEPEAALGDIRASLSELSARVQRIDARLAGKGSRPLASRALNKVRRTLAGRRPGR
ncbi:putative O-methyltransferase YrrM [Spinactinospora alkalitolerans]|uniref:Putative O-methyltransferase YrrM n=1 Tax=Spinactinospora alkalitolerans TaxID=687207 RepID=A0A852U272_9ACTN|nr:class I SAM-dependent methyltransferase [Spinactinospora alkalitolerans]NYE49697.1 putative O-methyltransferase YrrM [Spinactinospora alkalitolerans]